MPEREIKKLYYSIGEISALTGLDQHVLRFWESEFDQLTPKKNRAGRRIYTSEDLETVRTIQYLLKERRYTIEGARQVLAGNGEGEGHRRERRRQFMELRAFLVDLLDKLPPPPAGSGEERM